MSEIQKLKLIRLSNLGYRHQFVYSACCDLYRRGKSINSNSIGSITGFNRITNNKLIAELQKNNLLDSQLNPLEPIGERQFNQKYNQKFAFDKYLYVTAYLPASPFYQLGLADTLVYSYIRSLTDSCSWSTISGLAKMTTLSARSVSESIKKLDKLGLIEIVRNERSRKFSAIGISQDNCKNFRLVEKSVINKPKPVTDTISNIEAQGDFTLYFNMCDTSSIESQFELICKAGVSPKVALGISRFIAKHGLGFHTGFPSPSDLKQQFSQVVFNSIDEFAIFKACQLANVDFATYKNVEFRLCRSIATKKDIFNMIQQKKITNPEKQKYLREMFASMNNDFATYVYRKIYLPELEVAGPDDAYEQVCFEYEWAQNRRPEYLKNYKAKPDDDYADVDWGILESEGSL